MCSGDDHGLVDLCITPSFSICANSFLAAISFSPSKRRNLEETGGPVVWIKCKTPELGAGRDFPAFTTAG
jgi:hypothetical protein